MNILKTFPSSYFSKPLLLLFSLFLLCSGTEAKKRLYPVEVLIGTADLVVTGAIKSVSDSTYTFTVLDIVKGNAGKEITVKMFREWTCDIRAKKAVPGQRLLLFLTANRDAYDIINGSTGEIFISDDNRVQMQLNNSVYALADAISGIRNFVSGYSLLQKEVIDFSKIKFIQLLRDDQITALKKENSFSVWLFDEVKKYKVNKATNIS